MDCSHYNIRRFNTIHWYVLIVYLCIPSAINLTSSLDAHHHYSDAGMFPREFILRAFTNYYWITIHMLSGAELVMQFLFIVEILIAFCMLVGYRTRTMTILSWIFV